MLSASADTSDQISDTLIEVGALAVTFQDTGNDPVYEPLPGERPLWETTSVIGLFDANVDVDTLLLRLQSRLDANTPHNCQIKYFDDQDWERVWLEHFQPMQFGDNLWVCPTTVTPPAPDAINIMLDPGLAFGTGTHATTAQCLEAMSTLDFSQKQVLDYGCGSGILAIAAALLGAGTVWAIDIDQQALIATRDNAQRNHVDEQIITALPDGLDQQLSFDILLANILSGPLIELAQFFSTRLKSGSLLILSGILAEQAESVRRHYEQWFDFEKENQRDGWACLVAKRR